MTSKYDYGFSWAISRAISRAITVERLPKYDYRLQSSDFQVRLRIQFGDSKSDLQSSDFQSTTTDYSRATSKYDYGFSLAIPRTIYSRATSKLQLQIYSRTVSKSGRIASRWYADERICRSSDSRMLDSVVDGNWIMRYSYHDAIGGSVQYLDVVWNRPPCLYLFTIWIETYIIVWFIQWEFLFKRGMTANISCCLSVWFF